MFIVVFSLLFVYTLVLVLYNYHLLGRIDNRVFLALGYQTKF